MHVRANAGLGSPPKPFTTNSSASLNNLLKRKVNFKHCKWPHFNKLLLAFVNDQQVEFEKAVFGQGEYELTDEFKYLEVAHCSWIQMNGEQRKMKIERTCNAKSICHVDLLSTTPGIQASKECLSIQFSNAKVDYVNLERVKTMWEKAEQLLSTESLILPAAVCYSTAPVK